MRTEYQARKERSLEMAKSGIEPITEKQGTYWVPSQSDKNRKYKIIVEPNGWASCECPDNSQNKNLCKHIILLKFFISAKKKAQQLQNYFSVTTCCPSCTSKDVQKDGTRKTTMGKKQRWLCGECNARFVAEPIKRIKGNLEVVIAAMDLCMKGVSYRGIKDSLKQLYGLKVSHITIMRWVQAYMAKINAYVAQLEPSVGKVWLTDEQIAHVKGKFHYIWNCMDSETRFLLANHVTASRATEDARNLFKQAKATARSKAETIVTDGAFAYEKAVRKEFATYQNPEPHERYVSLRQKSNNNNILERYHGTFRQRDKVMKGFKTAEGTSKFAENFKTYYNFVKPHETLGSTPAKAAKIEETETWRELLIKALAPAKEQPISNTPK